MNDIIADVRPRLGQKRLRLAVDDEQFLGMRRLWSDVFRQFGDEDVHKLVVARQFAAITVVGLEVDVEAIIVVFANGVDNGIGILTHSCFLLFIVAGLPSPEFFSRSFVGVVGFRRCALPHIAGEAAI